MREPASPTPYRPARRPGQAPAGSPSPCEISALAQPGSANKTQGDERLLQLGHNHGLAQAIATPAILLRPSLDLPGSVHCC